MPFGVGTQFLGKGMQSVRAANGSAREGRGPSVPGRKFIACFVDAQSRVHGTPERYGGCHSDAVTGSISSSVTVVACDPLLKPFPQTPQKG
jgi:hypothetical protein